MNGTTDEIPNSENDIVKWAKIYHYLDCSRFYK